jgi:hypothetical protein
MENLFEINLGTGLSSIGFGATKEEVEARLGKPEQIENVDEIIDQPTTVWHYKKNNISLFFDEKKTKKFVSVDIENKKSLLWGEKIFELSEDEIVIMFRGRGMYLFESEIQEWGEKRLSFDEGNIDFYFVEGEMTSINFGYITEGAQTLILPN